MEHHLLQHHLPEAIARRDFLKGTAALCLKMGLSSIFLGSCRPDASRDETRRYCQILGIDSSLAANTDGVCMNRSAGAGSDCNISASPSGNSTPALTKATR